MRGRVRGLPLLPTSWCHALGFWARREQRACPHPPHRRRVISGDERNYGHRQQCMECGMFSDDPPGDEIRRQGAPRG